MRAYDVYGLRVRSSIPLPCAAAVVPGPVEVRLVNGSASFFARVYRAICRPNETRWFQHVRLDDGSYYLRWPGLFEFVISSDGRRIAGRPLDGATVKAFQTYLLGQVLSFALLKRGIEPLHATAVVVDGQAIAFLGDCGYGKSSLGAVFLQAGHPVLTDDLLVVREDGDGFVAYPGPPRIKLFPEVARRLLGERIAGTPMNNLTPKLVIPLERRLVWPGAVPLGAVYVLAPPWQRSASDRITIRPLSPRRACLALLRNTFNAIVVDPQRLSRQFELAARLAREVAVRSLTFPRRFDRLAAVRDAIRSDLGSRTGPEPACS